MSVTPVLLHGSGRWRQVNLPKALRPAIMKNSKPCLIKGGR